MEPNALLKELKNTLYHALLTSKMIDTCASQTYPFDYAISNIGKGIKIEYKDEVSLINALSLLSRIDLKEILNYANQIKIKFSVRAIEITKDIENVSAHINKALELGYSHIIFNQPVEGKWPIKTGLRVNALHEMRSHDFYVYESDANRLIQEEKDLILADIFIRELEELVKSDKEVWYELPQNVTPSIIRKLDLRSNKKIHLIIKNDQIHALKQETKIGTALIPVVELKFPLWPSLETEVDEILSSMKVHAYKGLLVKVDRLPKGEGILDLNLWAMAQAQIRGDRLGDLLKAWLTKKKLNEPFYEVTRLAEILKSDKLKKNPSKSLLNKVLSEIQIIEDKSSSEHIRAFTRDARRLLHRSLQDNQVNLPYVLREEDYGPAFYTAAISFGGSSVRPLGEVDLKKNIDPSTFEGELAEIYDLNSIEG